MAKIYFVRHGESETNVKGIIGGQLDIPLTGKGHEQAMETGRVILAQRIQADEIISSPLQRARDTAQHISDIIGTPVRVDPRLIEQGLGIYEGSAPKKDSPFHSVRTHYFHTFGGTGESTLRVAQRVYNLLDELMETDKSYILVSHNGVAKVVRSYFQDMTNEDFSNYFVSNCSVVSFGE